MINTRKVGVNTALKRRDIRVYKENFQVPLEKSLTAALFVSGFIKIKIR
jgi:hypothetical protein